MKVIIAKDYNEQASIAATILGETIITYPDCWIGLASGSSTKGMYRELVRMYKEDGLSFQNVHAVHIDEYIGLSKHNEQSFRYFMDKHLFDQVNINKYNTYVPKGTDDIESNIVEFQNILNNNRRKIQVLGVGEDGHLGFNEAGDYLEGDVHIEKLSESSIKANSRFFANSNHVPREAITMGMRDILFAESILLIVSGKKENAARQLLMSNTITTKCPVTFLRLHSNVTVIIDKDIAEEIQYKQKK